jgi:hypothetical protein
MPTDNDLERMYDLSHCLHSDRGTALSVTLKACERVSLIRRIQGDAQGTTGGDSQTPVSPNTVYTWRQTRANAVKNACAAAGSVDIGQPLTIAW